jgi:hypothetical protein
MTVQNYHNTFLQKGQICYTIGLKVVLLFYFSTISLIFVPKVEL